MTSKAESSGATRASLLSRARRHDSVAWRELTELYGPLIAHWCRRCRLDTHASADCVQDVFAAVIRSIDRFEPQRTVGSFRGWLRTITSNKIRDYLRRTERWESATGGSTALRQISEVAEAASVPDTEPTDPGQIHQLVQRALAQVQDEFAEHTWEMFCRSVIDAVPTAQVAEEFDVTPATVRQARSRILRRVRQQLGDLEDF